MIAMAFKPTEENPGWKVRVGKTADVLIGDVLIQSKPASEAHILCKQIVDYDRFGLHILFVMPFKVTNSRAYDTCELLRIVISALELSNGRKIVHYSGRDENGYSNFTVNPAARFYRKHGDFHKYIDDFGVEKFIDSMAINYFDSKKPFLSRLEKKLMARDGATSAIAKTSKTTKKTKKQLRQEELENKLAAYKNG